MKVFSTIASLLLVFSLNAQTLYVPVNGNINAGPGAVITSTGDVQNEGNMNIGENGNLTSNQSFINNGGIFLGQNASLNSIFDFTNNSTIDIGEGGSMNTLGLFSNIGSVSIREQSLLNLGGNASNTGTITNLGLLRIQADWTNQGTYEGLSGDIEFAGGGDQIIFNDNLQVSRLTMNSGGKVTLTGNTIEVFDELDFTEGILSAHPSTRFVVDNSTTVSGGSEFSYYEGPLLLQGGPEDPGDDDTEVKFFPVGKNGRYNPITLQSIQNEDFYEISAELFTPNDIPPIPGDDMIGVSDESYWKIDLETGVVDSAELFIDFFGEDLNRESFININDIKADSTPPVVAYANGLDSTWFSLGASEYTGDFLTEGIIVSNDKLPFNYSTQYVAIGIAPRIPDRIFIYVPQAFAPADPREANQRFRVFGENISSNNFRFVVLNRFNNVMYETTDFTEANEFGWDGTHNGVEQPAGVYFYILQAENDEGIPYTNKNKGVVYLVR